MSRKREAHPWLPGDQAVAAGLVQSLIQAWCPARPGTRSLLTMAATRGQALTSVLPALLLGLTGKSWVLPRDTLRAGREALGILPNPVACMAGARGPEDPTEPFVYLPGCCLCLILPCGNKSDGVGGQEDTSMRDWGRVGGRRSPPPAQPP